MSPTDTSKTLYYAYRFNVAHANIRKSRALGRKREYYMSSVKIVKSLVQTVVIPIEPIIICKSVGSFHRCDQ